MLLLGFYALKAPRLLAFAPTGAHAPEPEHDDPVALAAPAPPKQHGGYSQFSGPPPLIVVAGGNGHVWVVQAPSRSHLNSGDAAEAEPGSLTRGYLRCQSVVTAMCTAPAAPPSGAGVIPPGHHDGAFWLVACCADKAVRRYSLLTGVQQGAARDAAAAAAAAKPQKAVSMAQLAQSYAAPDMERTMELRALASCLRPSSCGHYLVAGCGDGSACVYGVADLVLHGRWGLHDPAGVGGVDV
ncbi:hypothetical protein FOA52_010827 [Chlamydomonas sp. UWO 241]|nr:hypothetical protein FOA52_010827 [Chlamydomonas sp. UWO 241]